ncbi:serine/threonine-protein kinase MARK1-like [Ochotona curzoniae]|uniref:serine/threonine-protein kinase MARK1-like n=1 Tax=Ochotona curzoniae TaxID=130825 RepID=UPI001B3499EF|nr:serine/threonine-protein kinase MARK1-like [Ochotona curzoniae]
MRSYNFYFRAPEARTRARPVGPQPDPSSPHKMSARTALPTLKGRGMENHTSVGGYTEPHIQPTKSSRQNIPRCRNSITSATDQQPHIGNYRSQKTIVKGNFAKVKLARHVLTGREVAVEIIDKAQLNPTSLQKAH